MLSLSTLSVRLSTFSEHVRSKGRLTLCIPAVALAFLTTMSLVPVLCFQRKFGDTAFRLLAWASMATSALAFMFMVGIASVAKQKFEQQGFKASYGNLVCTKVFSVSFQRIKHSPSMLFHLRRLSCCLQLLSAHTCIQFGMRDLTVVLDLTLNLGPPRDAERYQESR